MGDSFTHEFSIGGVDTGRTTPPKTIQVPSGDLTQPNATQPMQIPGAPIMRPSFLQAFLANLGPALAGGIQFQPNGQGGGNYAGLGGALQGIQNQNRYNNQLALQRQEAQRQQDQTASQIALQAEQLKQAQQMGPLNVQQAQIGVQQGQLGLQRTKALIDLANTPGGVDQMLAPMAQSLGTVKPDEQAQLDAAKQEVQTNLRQGKLDVSPYNKAVTKISQDRIEAAKTMAQSTPFKDYKAAQEKAQGFPLTPKQIQDFQTLGPRIIMAGANERQDKSFQQQNVQDVRKRYDTALDAEQRLSRMESSYQKGLKGDQQAMLALLTDHIGMTLGMQKGARITKDILNEAQASQPWLQKIGAKFDNRGYLSGVTLGKDQMRQMLDLGYEASDRALQGAQDAGTLYDVPKPANFDKVFGKRKPGEKPAITGLTPGTFQPLK